MTCRTRTPVLLLVELCCFCAQCLEDNSWTVFKFAVVPCGLRQTNRRAVHIVCGLPSGWRNNRVPGQVSGKSWLYHHSDLPVLVPDAAWLLHDQDFHQWVCAVSSPLHCRAIFRPAVGVLTSVNTSAQLLIMNCHQWVCRVQSSSLPCYF